MRAIRVGYEYFELLQRVKAKTGVGIYELVERAVNDALSAPGFVAILFPYKIDQRLSDISYATQIPKWMIVAKMLDDKYGDNYETTKKRENSKLVEELGVAALQRSLRKLSKEGEVGNTPHRPEQGEQRAIQPDVGVQEVSPGSVSPRDDRQTRNQENKKGGWF